MPDRIRSLTTQLSTAAVSAVATLALLAVAAGTAAADPRVATDSLYSRGYTDIRITEHDDDEYEALACRGGALYEFEIDRGGRIEDRDRVGRCGRGYASRDDDVHVEAPFTGVHVDEHGVSVRAPFVDLHVPRR